MFQVNILFYNWNNTWNNGLHVLYKHWKVKPKKRLPDCSLKPCCRPRKLKTIMCKTYHSVSMCQFKFLKLCRHLYCIMDFWVVLKQRFKPIQNSSVMYAKHNSVDCFACHFLLGSARPRLVYVTFRLIAKADPLLGISIVPARFSRRTILPPWN